MDTVTLARSLFGSSMAFHIIFATLGVGIPAMIVFAEILFQITKDRHYSVMAQRWTRGFAIILGVAIPSGTIVGVMLALLWPGFMEIVGQVIALPFQIEIWAFFLEALFMSIYVYAADRLTPSMRIVSVICVAIGASASAVLITDAHAWMNTPQGFTLAQGNIATHVDPWAAVFNPGFLVTSIHVVVSAYMTGAFAIASVAAYKLLRGKKTKREYVYHSKSLWIALLVGAVMSLFTAVNGHESAKGLHQYQPEKLAAAEGLFVTTAHAPLVIGGIVDEQSGGVIGGVEVPGLLSFLATNRMDGVVKGLNDFPRENWPPLFIHTLFNLMVGIGSFLILLSMFALAIRLIWKKPYPRWLLWVLAASFPLSILGVETGWIFSCTGRQPWTIYHMQRTADASTHAANVGILFILFISLYVFLLFVTIFVMKFYFQRHPLAKELV